MTDRYELWHGRGTRSLRILWTASELGVGEQFDVHLVAFPPRLKQPDYLSVNTLGSLPFFRHDEAELSESMAACQYLAALHPAAALSVGADEAGFPQYLQFCWFGEATLMPPIGTLVTQQILLPDGARSAAAIGEARTKISARLDLVTAALTRSQFLAAERFTLADISVGYALVLLDLLGARDLFPSTIESYYLRLTERPAYVRAASI